MLLGIFICLIILNLIFRNSRISFISLALYLWLLFGWSFGTADWEIYTNRYENYITMSSRTEFLFTGLMKFGHTFHMDFRQFLIIISLVCLFLICFTIWRLSSAPGMALALYSIFSFPMDVTQIRFFIAFSVVIFGLNFYMDYINRKNIKSLVLWIGTVLVAMNIHMLAILSLLFLLPLFFNRKIIIAVAGGVTVIMLGLSTLSSRVMSVISSFLGEEKAELVMSQSEKYSKSTVYFVWFKIVFIFAGFLALYFLIKYFMKSGKFNYRLSNREGYEKALDTVLDCNIIILVVLGLVTVTTDFYRIQQIVVLMNYIVISNYMVRVRYGKISLINIAVICISVFFAFMSLYYLVISSANIDTVFWPLFEKNVIFR